MANAIPTQPMGTEYAGFWLRSAALLIDAFLLYIALLAMLSTFSAGIDAAGLENATVGLGLAINASVIALTWFYCAAFEASSLQATPGKIAVGIHVTDHAGEPVGFVRISARYLAKFLSAALLLAGFLMAAFTRRRESLHDCITGCLVVRHRVRIPAAANDWAVTQPPRGARAG